MLSSRLGLSAVCGATADHSETRLSAAEIACPPGAPSNLRLKASWVAHRRKPKPTAPNQWWGVDMTKVLIDGFGWVYVVLVLDWYTKKVVGDYTGLQAKTWHWLVALNTAVHQQFPDGAKNHALSLDSG
ncbi:DDE-type integrase/transposase/recombinase [Candidatus Nitronereus thalassa]|uniref:DDE-type integrase/transposase/recombinase n=1 Tax=Candidatus Nitronereus thalassa TaxID=3020898 RepID=A0ABU3K461_9BACT|nr:DDE-type integrase/transposase/recombinase [Candidatus Nitronereus thalassa]MDT7041190.1 DDE-type integrase/transposase/recombinase [Candidatus Nitronereus thalassa]